MNLDHLEIHQSLVPREFPNLYHILLEVLEGNP